MPSFAELGVIPEIIESLDKLKFKNPTEIQTASIPTALEGRDIIGLAQTGSGKTAAFAIPILQTLFANPQPIYACVMAPTYTIP
jgi:ATP-dependent RNA helicase DDX47/RRP3